VTGLDGRAAALRQAFDAGFTHAPVIDARAPHDLLALTVGGDGYVFAMREIASLAVDRAITPLPTAVRELTGLAGLRGAIVPVYDLALLLGYARPASARWLAVVAGAPLALAFERFDGYVRQPAGDVAFEAADGLRGRHVHAIARTADWARPVVAVRAVLETIRQRVPDAAGDKERS
jgi:chemotaxis signal transduction protein